MMEGARKCPQKRKDSKDREEEESLYGLSFQLIFKAPFSPIQHTKTLHLYKI